MVVPARLHDQCIEANSRSELVITNWFYNWFSLYKSLMHIPRVNISLVSNKYVPTYIGGGSKSRAVLGTYLYVLVVWY